MLADVFENFGNMCLEIYELDPAKFLSAPRLAWQAALKKTTVKLDVLTDINVINGKKRNWRSNISLYQYAKANKKYMKDYDKNKESSYLQYWDRNNLNELHNDFYLKESKLKKSKSL